MSQNIQQSAELLISGRSCGPNWSAEEDVQLCLSIEQATDDTNSDNFETFWPRFYKDYQEHFPNTSRNENSLLRRWTFIKRCITQLTDQMGEARRLCPRVASSLNIVNTG